MSLLSFGITLGQCYFVIDNYPVAVDVFVVVTCIVDFEPEKCKYIKLEIYSGNVCNKANTYSYFKNKNPFDVSLTIFI